MTSIYIDVDDTLACFRKHAVSRGVPDWKGTWYTSDQSNWTPEQKEIQAATNAQMAMPDFWLTMPIDPEAFELIAAARKKTDDVYLLTALPNFALADTAMSMMIHGAKMEFATNALHMRPERVIICARADKVKFAAHPIHRGVRNVLIDDAELNCREWNDAGGIAIRHDDNIHLGMRETIRAVQKL